jgi:hypothetical protein
MTGERMRRPGSANGDVDGDEHEDLIPLDPEKLGTIAWKAGSPMSFEEKPGPKDVFVRVNSAFSLPGVMYG